MPSSPRSARPPPLSLPSKRSLSDELLGFDGLRGSGSSSRDETGTPTDWDPDGRRLSTGSEGRPSNSALLTTFQRLGVSRDAAGSAVHQDAKRLRVSLASREDSPVDIELHQHVVPSPVVRSGPPSVTASPSVEEQQQQQQQCAFLNDSEMSAQHCRSPTDLERLSPVSQLLLCSRPGQLQRHLAVPRPQSSIPVEEATVQRVRAMVDGGGGGSSSGGGGACHGGTCGIGACNYAPHTAAGPAALVLAPLGPRPSRTLSAPSLLERAQETPELDTSVVEVEAALAAHEAAVAAGACGAPAAISAVPTHVAAATGRSPVAGDAPVAAADADARSLPLMVQVPTAAAFASPAAEASGVHTPLPARRLMRRCAALGVAATTMEAEMADHSACEPPWSAAGTPTLAFDGANPRHVALRRAPMGQPLTAGAAASGATVESCGGSGDLTGGATGVACVPRETAVPSAPTLPSAVPHCGTPSPIRAGERAAWPADAHEPVARRGSRLCVGSGSAGDPAWVGAEPEGDLMLPRELCVAPSRLRMQASFDDRELERVRAGTPSPGRIARAREPANVGEPARRMSTRT